MEKKTIGREAWIEAALKVLSKEGVGQVRVELLAKRLGVTKGSFYWHFSNRAELLRAVLSHWRRLATADIIAHAEASASEPKERLTRLMLRVSQSRAAPGLEAGIRAWGVSDEEARLALEEIDSQREGYVRGLLVAHGLTREIAARRARALYLMLIGEYTWISHQGKPSSLEVWQEIVRMVLLPSE